MNEQSDPKVRLFNNDNYDTLTAIIVVLAGIFLALIGFEDTSAGDNAKLLSAEIQQLTIRSATILASGQLDADYGWNQAYRLWLEMNNLSIDSYYRDDNEGSERYDTLRDELVSLSPLLQAPYFDAVEALETYDDPDLALYEADTYIVQFHQERQNMKATREKKNYWEEVSDNYELLTEYIAIALTLIGIASTVMNSLKLRFLVTILMGGVIVFSGLKGLSVYLSEPPIFSDDAIEYLAQAEGLHHQLLYQDAIDAYTQAIETDDKLINAFEQRAFAARNLYSEEFDLALITDIAIPDLQSVVDAGNTSKHVVAQLAELHFLLGNFKEAKVVSQHGIDTSDEFGHYFDLGLTELAQGNVESAQSTYEQGIEKTREEYDHFKLVGEPPLDFYFNLDIAIEELDDLTECYTRNICNETPAKDLLPAEEDYYINFVEIGKQLKALSIELEIFNGVKQEGTSATVSEFVVDIDEDLITVEFDYEDILQDSVIHIKLYRGTFEETLQRQTFTWDDAESGTSQITYLIAEQDEYDVQMFINGELVQQGYFQFPEEE
jgi:hypothetical protein